MNKANSPYLSSGAPLRPMLPDLDTVEDGMIFKQCVRDRVVDSMASNQQILASDEETEVQEMLSGFSSKERKRILRWGIFTVTHLTSTHPHMHTAHLHTPSQPTHPHILTSTHPYVTLLGSTTPYHGGRFRFQKWMICDPHKSSKCG